MFVCQIDNQSFETRHLLHNYVSRRLKVKLEDYYSKYDPKYDLLTHEPLPFKNYEQYFHSLFLSRANMVAYFKKYPKDRENLLECMKLRQRAKNLKYAPSTVEARTSIFPSPLFVYRLGHDYAALCREAGMEVRYDYDANPIIDKAGTLDIIVDTREQVPVKVGDSMTHSKIDFGDYVPSSSHYKRIYVERKSLCDLAGTLSKGYERFQKELTRAAAMDAYVVVMVEESLPNFLKIGSTPSTAYISATPEFLGTRIRNLCQAWNNVQFLFVENRMQMTDAMEKIFRLRNDVRGIDLQYWVDSKKI